MSEKRVRVVFEAIGGAEAADDAERLEQALGELPGAQSDATDGAAELRAELDRLRGQVASLEQAHQRNAQSTQQASASATQHAQSAIQLTQRLASATNAIAGMASALGGSGSGLAQGAGLVGRLAASAAAGAQLGLVLGPQGAIVGGILGAAIPAFEQFITAQERASTSSATFRSEVEATARALETELGRIRDRDDALSGEFGDRATSSLTAQQRRSEATIALLQQQLHDAQEAARVAADEILGNETLANAGAREVARIRGLIEAENEVVAAIHGEISARQLAANAAEDQAAATDRVAAAQAEERIRAQEAAQHEAQRARFAAAAQRAEAERVAQANATLRALEERRERELDQQAEYLRLLAEAIEKEHEHADAVVAAERRVKVAREQAEAEAAQRAAQQRRTFEEQSRELLLAEQRDRTALLDRERAAREEELSVFGDMASNVSRSLVKAVSELASGTKTADEAFKGMLASFLESVAEQALISAAREYAEAIASFARYDFGGGAGHVAAGVAFTAVAVATGAAAGAISAQPPSQGQAARPDSVGAGAGDSGRTRVVVNMNAPVVTAGTEAETGRITERLGRSAVRRFGRLAA